MTDDAQTRRRHHHLTQAELGHLTWIAASLASLGLGGPDLWDVIVTAALPQLGGGGGGGSPGAGVGEAAAGGHGPGATPKQLAGFAEALARSGYRNAAALKAVAVQAERQLSQFAGTCVRLEVRGTSCSCCVTSCSRPAGRDRNRRSCL